MVVDDYAHHPTEVKATLKAQKLAGNEEFSDISTILFTRTRDFFQEFSSALQMLIM